MKRPIAIAAVLALMLALPLMSQAAPSGVPKAADLFAGKTTDVGDVYVWNDATNLYVEIVLADGWCMTESHVAAATAPGGIPQNSQQNPTPGQFAYGDSYSPCESNGDQFTIPLPGALGSSAYLAVHARVWDESATASLDVFSNGGNTTVTASSAGGTLPRIAPDAWEAYGDPIDPTPSVWDSGVGASTFALADWIWSDYRVLTPTVDETATFVRTFSVPGPVAPGSWMKATTDDAFTAKLNGATVAVGTYPNWPTVQTASPFVPVWGSNALTFAAVNSAQYYGDAGTIDTNPGGLIYEAKVNYFNKGDSAWAGTPVGQTQFNPSKSWATYFLFNTVLETAPVYDVTASPSTTWSCIVGATDTNTPLANSSVTWAMAGSTVYVKVAVEGAQPSSTFDVWVEQNPGTCPPGTSTPSNPAALTTDVNGDGTLSFSFAAVAGANHFWLSMWTPAGSLTGTQVLRTTAVVLP